MGVSRAFLKHEPLERKIFVVPPLSSDGNPDARWKLRKPLYELTTARNEWYGALKESPVKDLGGTGWRY